MFIKTTRIYIKKSIKFVSFFYIYYLKFKILGKLLILIEFGPFK